MVIADTSKDKDSKVTTTCSDCHYNVYRMLGEEVQKLKEPDERGEHYNPFSQNGKIVQVATYIQCAYRDGYKHGHKDGYKNGFDDGQADANGKYFEDGYKQGYEQHGKDFILDGERIREDALKEGRLEVLASIKDLCNSLESEESWESDACDGCCRANSNFESEHMSAVLKDLYNSLESEGEE